MALVTRSKDGLCRRQSSLAFVITAVLAATAPAMVQGQTQSQGSSGLLEEIVVTARKREELATDVPLSVSAYNANQLESLKIRDMTNLAVAMPNVATDDIGTIKGTANFSIRGLGINSSIPSIDPTVGVFVDGVYIGVNNGLVLDMFDIASIEVLRGPQGTLFGRNVTGGAILINTKRPTEQLEFSARGAIDGGGDGGLSQYYMASVSGPLSDNLGGRLSIYHNSDDGWFENEFNGEDHGESNTTIFRPVLSWDLNDRVNMVFRWEHLESDGDGPASQSHTNGLGIPAAFANFDRDSFNFSIDEPGFFDFEKDLFTWETNWSVDWGNGTITNIFGWREYNAESVSDIDAQPVWLFHAPAFLDTEQWSNELRYNGQFDRSNVTFGLFVFDNEID
ncbi:MAG: TonB-dependent receptor, partial [Xanthomonadales bacterium]|nr:TonB-dependent receptor [Xanthomonadales bacterium]